jgi:putative MFS transporter
MTMTVGSQEVNVGGRLDRLPISSVHRKVLFALAFAYFFDMADYNTFGFCAPMLMKSWNLSVTTVAQITTWSFLGMFIGGTMGGWFGDRVGRKRGLQYTTLMYCGFSLLNAFAWNTISLGLFRFLTGVGVSALIVIANTYISEFFPPNARGKYQGWAMMIGLCGIPATAWVARLIIPMAPWAWRLVFIWGSLGFIGLFLVTKMVESPRWLEIHGRIKEADAVLTSLESEITAECGPLPQPKPTVSRGAVASVPYLELFQGRYLGRTTVLLMAWIFQTLGFYGFIAWVPTLLVKHGFSIVSSLTYSSFMAFGSPLGALISSQIAERIDRKWGITIFSALVGVFGLLYGLTFHPLLIIIFGFLVMVSASVFLPLLYAYSPELYPTEARASGTGLTYGVGRLGNVMGPLIVSFLYVGYGYISVFTYIASCWVIVALAVGFFGPHTHKRSLEQISGNPQEEGVGQKHIVAASSGR